MGHHEQYKRRKSISQPNLFDMISVDEDDCIEKKVDIELAVSSWLGDGNKDEEVPVRVRRSKSLQKKLKHRLSSSAADARKEGKKITSSPGRSISQIFTRNSSQLDFTDFAKLEPRLTPEIALFYLKQQLPEDFPLPILQYLYKTHDGRVHEIYNSLKSKGWHLELQETEDCSVPPYYFGAWSYDCWCVFDCAPVGAFITCIKQNRYYLAYKNEAGNIIFDVVSKPRVLTAKKKHLKLTKALTRPPKRYICKKCMNNTPCELLNPEFGHSSELCNYELSFPK